MSDLTTRKEAIDHLLSQISSRGGSEQFEARVRAQAALAQEIVRNMELKAQLNLLQQMSCR